MMTGRNDQGGMRRAARTWCAVTILLAHGTAIMAQDAKPLARLDTAAILIGQQARMELSVTYRVDQGPVAIQWPTVTDTLTAMVAVVHEGQVDTVLPDKQNDPFLFRQQRMLTITSWDSGYWAIPPFHFIINGDTAETSPLLLTVNTVAVDTTQAIRDIKEIYTVPFSLWDWLLEHWKYWTGGLAAVAIIAAILFFLYRRTRQPKPEAPPPAPVPLRTRTLAALEALQQQKLWQQGHTKRYHSELTDILRSYLQERYGVPAMEQTTDELLAALRMTAMPRAQQEGLAPILRLADMVKFAKWSALPTENEQVMASAFKLVAETAEKPTDAPIA